MKRTKKDTVDNNITYMEVNAIEYEWAFRKDLKSGRSDLFSGVTL
jgi:hypothetical protein